MSEGDEPSENDPEPEAPPEPPAPAPVTPDVEPPEDYDDELDDEELPEDEEQPAQRSRRRRLERLVPEIIKRAIERGIEAGLGTLSGKPKEGGRDSVPPPPKEPAKDPAKDARARELGSVPKEIAGYVFSQIDDTKNAMVRVVAREVREFLEAADLSTELQKALTSLSFEIRTEIRFIPNEVGGIKPEVKAKVAPAVKRDRPPGRRPTAFEDEDER